MKKVFSFALAFMMFLCFSIACFAADDSFTPSVKAKTAPEIITVRNESDSNDTTEYAATIVETNGSNYENVKIVNYVNTVSLNTVSYADKDKSTTNETIRKNLVTAYNEVMGKKNLGSLNKELNNVAAKINNTYDASVFVASDLFDLTVSDEYYQKMNSSDNVYLRVTFNIRLEANDRVPVVMHRDTETGEWKIVDEKNVINNGDGTITVYFNSLCPILFLKVSADRVNALSNGFICPFCSGSFCWGWLIGIIAVLIIELVIYLIYLLLKKKKNNGSDKTPSPDEPETPTSPTPAPESTDVNIDNNAAESEFSVQTTESVETESEDEGTVTQIAEEAVNTNPSVSMLVAHPDNVNLVRYRKSFLARLIQAPDETKERYEKVKNEILSYKGMKARTSWSCETFNRGRNKLVKFNVRGKTLVVYLALNPADFADTKYNFSDASDLSKFNETPMAVKITSDRAVKWAKELIAVMMDNNQIARGKEVFDKYYMPYEDSDALIDKGLIKVIIQNGKNNTDNAPVEKFDIGELFNDEKNEK